MARLGEAGDVRKATLCASRTPAGYACGPGENFFFPEVLNLRARKNKSPLARALIFGAPGEIRTPDHLVRRQIAEVAYVYDVACQFLHPCPTLTPDPPGKTPGNARYPSQSWDNHRTRIPMVAIPFPLPGRHVTPGRIKRLAPQARRRPARRRDTSAISFLDI